MAIVKINEPGWNKFTGNFGGVEFVDGVSAEEVSRLEIGRLAAALKIEEVLDQNEDGVVAGKQLGISSDLARGAKINAKVVERVTTVSKEEVKNEKLESGTTGVTDEHGNPYTREILEKVADAKGINGIREVAEKFDVKGASIVAIIDKIEAKLEA